MDDFRNILEGTGAAFNKAHAIGQSENDLRILIIIEKRLLNIRIVEGCRRNERPCKAQVYLLAGLYGIACIQPLGPYGADSDGAVFAIIAFRLFKECAAFGTGRSVLGGGADERVLAEVIRFKGERAAGRTAAHIGSRAAGDMPHADFVRKFRGNGQRDGQAACGLIFAFILPEGDIVTHGIAQGEAGLVQRRFQNPLIRFHDGNGGRHIWRHAVD